MITIWVKEEEDLNRLYDLIKRMESVFVLDSEIHNAWIEWDSRPQTDWIQVQINYSTYLRLKEA
jgi:hypothetical protein